MMSLGGIFFSIATYMGDDEFIAEFLDECDENLEGISRGLAVLHSNPSDAAALNRLFRCIHTIKGSSGFLGFSKMNAITYDAERVLGRVRDGDLPFDASIESVLKNTADAIRRLRDEIANTGTEGSQRLLDVTNQLQSLLDDSVAGVESALFADRITSPSDDSSITTRSPTAKTRVLLVDDSPIVRSFLAKAFAQTPDIEAVAEARDGVEGLQLIERLRPDVILLDVDMPRMDGLEMLRHLKDQRKNIPVLMFSSRTEQGAQTTTEALMLGANDFVFKPGGTNMRDFDAGRLAIKNEIIPRLRSLSRTGPPSDPHIPRSPKRKQVEVELIVIGASTGGPAALARLFTDQQLRNQLSVPIVVAQHMPRLFTKHLAERLADDTGHDVSEAVNGQPLEPGMIRFAPGGRHAVVVRRNDRLVTKVNDDPPVNSCRPSVDVLFQSAAPAVKERLLAIVLTGMGKDGRQGCHNVHDHDGRIIVQDAATSVVWGMPGAVAKAGLADHVVPINKLAALVAKKLQVKG